jgi:hypothetical protein
MAAKKASLPEPGKKARAMTSEVVDQARDFVADRYLEIVQALYDRAIGLCVKDEKGNVYTREPDVTAAKILLEFLGGKPVARVEQGQPGEFEDYETWILSQKASTPAPVEEQKSPIAFSSGPLALSSTSPTVADLTPTDISEGNRNKILSTWDRMEDVLRDVGWKDE